ncbi:MAG TPA: hypothetical protein ENF55_01725 [Thermoprotei archaeon]|nr:hypothetical protein [Thermoprotei archaeon]
MKTIGKDVILTLFIAGLFISNIVSLLGSSTRTFTFSPREEYLRLAEEAYRWMMQFQITPPGTPWGWHLNCSEAWGGLAGYYTRKYRCAALHRD